MNIYPFLYGFRSNSKVVSKCTIIDSIITEKRQSIETMKAYKKSLIYEYVTGKKRVKGHA
jgi:hypothetical protein